MRLVSDFFAGAMAGLRPSSCTKGQGGARPRRRSPLAEILIRACLLAVAVGVAAIALLAASALD